VPVSAKDSGFEIAKDGIVGLVVGYDESPPSRDAVAFAAGIARRNKAWMIVAFIANIPAAAAMAPMTVPLVTADAREPDVMAGLAELGVQASFQHAVGDVATELERIAEEAHGRHRGRPVGVASTRLCRIGHHPLDPPRPPAHPGGAVISGPSRVW
jgi:hypothetical protein